ncbi:hypothetical protein PybrP1_001867, partial [[Pythium] brassicae (nom. inval.)]
MVRTRGRPTEAMWKAATSPLSYFLLLFLKALWVEVAADTNLYRLQPLEARALLVQEKQRKKRALDSTCLLCCGVPDYLCGERSLRRCCACSCKRNREWQGGCVDVRDRESATAHARAYANARARASENARTSANARARAGRVHNRHVVGAYVVARTRGVHVVARTRGVHVVARTRGVCAPEVVSVLGLFVCVLELLLLACSSG